jgi:RHS repeat-associated protein
VKFNGEYYDYVQNLQGDIVGMVDLSGQSVVEYSYDAWGKPTGVSGSMAGTLGAVNPFRYRGYVWDEETGLHVTATRYYSPEWGRWLNTDALLGKTGALLSHNLFAYCLNDPVNMSDSTGLSPISIHTIYTLNQIFGEQWTDKEGKKRRMGGGILIDLKTMKAFKVGWGDVRDDGYHLDVSPKTAVDSEIVRGIAKAGGFPLTGGKAWNAREGILIYNGLMIPVGFNLCGHGESSMEGTDPGFKRHFCLYPYDAWGNKRLSTDTKSKSNTLAYRNAAKKADAKIIPGGMSIVVGLALGLLSLLRK